MSASRFTLAGETALGLQNTLSEDLFFCQIDDHGFVKQSPKIKQVRARVEMEYADTRELAIIGMYEHTYIRNSVGNIVPMLHEPPNEEEAKAIGTILSYYERVGFFNAETPQDEVENLKAVVLRVLRETEAKRFTAQLMMDRVMGGGGGISSAHSNPRAASH